MRREILSFRDVTEIIASVIAQSHKSHNASDKYPTMHHFVTQMCTHSVKKSCIVGYGTVALWDCEFGLSFPLQCVTHAVVNTRGLYRCSENDVVRSLLPMLTTTIKFRNVTWCFNQIIIISCVCWIIPYFCQRVCFLAPTYYLGHHGAVITVHLRAYQFTMVRQRLSWPIIDTTYMYVSYSSSGITGIPRNMMY